MLLCLTDEIKVKQQKKKKQQSTPIRDKKRGRLSNANLNKKRGLQHCNVLCVQHPLDSPRRVKVTTSSWVGFPRFSHFYQEHFSQISSPLPPRPPAALICGNPFYFAVDAARCRRPARSHCRRGIGILHARWRLSGPRSVASPTFTASSDNYECIYSVSAVQHTRYPVYRCGRHQS